ncbi:hypothetical protein Pfo_029406 [Paulownia fortunei]|nr:hypothetical protein Pfo_029406 [Paulownia fortunei]
MEKEERNIPRIVKPPVETEFFLQWGSRKRLRCVRLRGTNPAEVSSSSNASSSSRIRRRIISRFHTLSQKEASFSQPTSRYTRNSEVVTLRSESRKSSSGYLEKEERYYTTRGSTVAGLEENGKITTDGGAGNQGGDQENLHHIKSNNNGMSSSSSKKMVWPKLCIALSSKEKEEDFMAMKGCKYPQRPKKRAKVTQRTLLQLVSPGAWLTDMSLERYEVREKKNCKKKARGLKAMGSIESDSE